jgi:hypothetical protein
VFDARPEVAKVGSNMRFQFDHLEYGVDGGVPVSLHEGGPARFAQLPETNLSAGAKWELARQGFGMAGRALTP